MTGDPWKRLFTQARPRGSPGNQCPSERESVSVPVGWLHGGSSSPAGFMWLWHQSWGCTALGAGGCALLRAALGAQRWVAGTLPALFPRGHPVEAQGACSRALAGRRSCYLTLALGFLSCSREMESVAGKKSSCPLMLFQLQDWVGMWSFSFWLMIS